MASKPPRLKSHAASEFLQSLPLAIWCPRQGPSSRKPSRSRWRLGRVRQRAQGSARVLSCFSLCVTQAALVLMAAGASTDDVDDMLAARRILGPGERLPLSHANACALGARQVCNGSRARPVSQRVRSRVDVQPVFLSFKQCWDHRISLSVDYFHGPGCFAKAYCTAVAAAVRSKHRSFRAFMTSFKQADLVTADASYFFQDARTCAQLQAAKTITTPILMARRRSNTGPD